MTTSFTLSLVTPAAECVSEPARLVEVPGEEGDMGVMPGHAPLVSMIRPGVVTIHSETNVEKWFITAGYVDVTPERCSILAESATRLADLNLREANARKKAAVKAVSKAKTELEKTRAEKDLREAEALVEALAA